jgi:hypothetical protein
VERQLVTVDLLAETPSADAVAIRLNKPPQLPVDGKHRKVVAYCGPGLSVPELAVLLEELAGTITQALEREVLQARADLEAALALTGCDP